MSFLATTEAIDTVRFSLLVDGEKHLFGAGSHVIYFKLGIPAPVTEEQLTRHNLYVWSC